MNRNSLPMLVVLPLLVSGCYSEGLIIKNLVGQITIPREAATRTITQPGLNGAPGTSEEITDVKLIGPVYVGLYAGLTPNLQSYVHPNIGPINQDTYPYGGTTLGDMRNSCLEFFTCRLTSNRFTSYQEIVDWFTDVVGAPPTDSQGRTIATGDYIRQNCFDLLEYTSDQEIRILPPDRNEDGVVDAEDLDFVENADGDFVGRFEILQAEFYPGMTAWAFMDAPSTVQYSFSTCDPANGYFEGTYDRQYQAGLQFSDVLNRPSAYLIDGDWVSSEGFVWDDPEDDAQILIDERVGGQLAEGEGE
jgi:hypothetical protein